MAGGWRGTGWPRQLQSSTRARHRSAGGAGRPAAAPHLQQQHVRRRAHVGQLPPALQRQAHGAADQAVRLQHLVLEEPRVGLHHERLQGQGRGAGVVGACGRGRVWRVCGQEGEKMWEGVVGRKEVSWCGRVWIVVEGRCNDGGAVKVGRPPRQQLQHCWPLQLTAAPSPSAAQPPGPSPTCGVSSTCASAAPPCSACASVPQSLVRHMQSSCSGEQSVARANSVSPSHWLSCRAQRAHASTHTARSPRDTCAGGRFGCVVGEERVVAGARRAFGVSAHRALQPASPAASPSSLPQPQPQPHRRAPAAGWLPPGAAPRPAAPAPCPTCRAAPG